MISTRMAGASALPDGSSARYELKAELARGGMGVVYRAFDRLAAREVAYKRLALDHESTRGRFVALFEREYNTLSQLTHPAIVTAYEYGFDQRGPYYTMELLAGRGLSELAPLPYRELCRVLRDLASALALLHARRLIHRDLSPANVRVLDDGRTKLIDFGALVPFGIAQDVVGTPAFMAPESLAGAPLDQRADLYALGALAYWGLTRKSAVRAHSIADLPDAWLEPIVPPSRHVEGVPAALEELLLSLLARDPLARPASASEVIERLNTIAELPPEPEEARVAASYMAQPPLVGRAHTLSQIDAALAAAGGGRGASLWVEGDQGQGRSALLDRVAVHAQLAGTMVLRASAGSARSAFGVARALVRQLLGVYPDLRGSTERGADLEPVLTPERREEGAWSPVQASERQARALARTQEIILECAARHPAVILVDELERADAESQALLAALSSEAAERPLLLVLSSSRGAEGAEACAQIKKSSHVLELTALDVDETVELVDALFGGAANSQRLAHWVHARSRGNPARSMDLLRLLLQRGLISYAAGTFTLPHDVSDDVVWQDADAVLLGRLLDLSPIAQASARILSLQELPMRVHDLARAIDAQLPAVMHALEELGARHAVNVSDERAALLGSALRSALVATLGDTERRALHTASARAILAGGKLDHALRMQAGMHLLAAGAEAEAVTLLTARGEADFLRGATPFPLLESVLEVLRRQGRSDAQCLGVLVPLVRGGFFGDFQAQQRHLKRTLRALRTVCGVDVMGRVRPKLGDKPAMIAGIGAGLLQHARTPEHMRYGKLPETVAALLSILSASVAASASALEGKQGFDIVEMFDPLRCFGPDSAPALSIEFCLATAELGVNRYASARARYQRLLERFQRPVKGMSDEVHLQFKQGILHGLAQVLVAYADPECLRLADELEQAHVFFAPHAQTVRMGYHGYRGDMERVTEYRRRGELLALRGGISWSAVTIMTVRTAYMALHTGDVATLMRMPLEFTRLAEVAPKMLGYRDAFQAALELLRGRPERAVVAYEALFTNPDAEYMMAHWADRIFYAKALSGAGRHQESRAVCEALLNKVGPDEVMYIRKGAIQQIALARAASGEIAGAAEQLDQLLAQLAPFHNPLWSGSAHRDRAKVALLAHDRSRFDQHARAMAEHFQSTRNPALIQQCERLHAAGQAGGLDTREVTALDESAVAFESHQAGLSSPIDVDQFETEMLPNYGADNDQREARRKI